MGDNSKFLIASRENDLKTLRKYIDNVEPNGIVCEAFKNSCVFGYLEQAKWLYSVQGQIFPKYIVMEAFENCIYNNQQEIVFWLLSTFPNELLLKDAFILSCEMENLKLARRIIRENPDTNFYVPFMRVYINLDGYEHNLGFPEIERFQYELDKARVEFKSSSIYPNFVDFLEKIHSLFFEYGDNSSQIVLDNLKDNLIALNNDLGELDDDELIDPPSQLIMEFIKNKFLQ